MFGLRSIAHNTKPDETNTENDAKQERENYTLGMNTEIHVNIGKQTRGL